MAEFLAHTIEPPLLNFLGHEESQLCPRNNSLLAHTACDEKMSVCDPHWVLFPSKT
jgi:hypothetical protein